MNTATGYTHTAVKLIGGFLAESGAWPDALILPIADAIQQQRRKALCISRLVAIKNLDYPDKSRTGAAKAIADELAQLPRKRIRFSRFPDSISPAEKRLMALPGDCPQGWRAIADYLDIAGTVAN